MKITNVSPPYPVLFPDSPEFAGLTGYTAGDFNAEVIDNGCCNGVLKLSADMRLIDQEQDLLRLIHEGKACYALHLEDSSSRFRELVISDEASFDCEVDISELRGTMVVYPCIVAKEKITGYASQNFASHFHAVGQFDFPRGLQLAIGGTYTIDLDDLLGRAKPPIVVFCNKNGKKAKCSEMIVETDKDSLRIGLEEGLYEAYRNNCKGRFKFTGLATILMPALMVALEILGKEWRQIDKNTESAWKVYIVNCLENIEKTDKVTISLEPGSDVGSLFWTVQRFLKSPYKKCIVEELGDRGE